MPPNDQCGPETTGRGWCNPLKISFTDAAKNLDWTGHRFEWGLRVYKNKYDLGLTFKIKLLKEIPNRNLAAAGPNIALHNPAGAHPRPL